MPQNQRRVLSPEELIALSGRTVTPEELLTLSQGSEITPQQPTFTSEAASHISERPSCSVPTTIAEGFVKSASV